MKLIENFEDLEGLMILSVGIVDGNIIIKTDEGMMIIQTSDFGADPMTKETFTFRDAEKYGIDEI